jgi:tetratricopeptide (TPR) repeat protein
VQLFLKGDEESPILAGKLGGSVWRKGCRWHVEMRGGSPMLELFMPKQTPEPWSFVVEGYHSLSRTAYDPYQQMILDGLWDDEAIEEKAKGDEYFRNGEYRSAVKCYDRTLERNPDSYVTLTNRAAAKLSFETEKFRLEEILEDAQRALEINPQWYKAKFREGVTLSKLHRYDEALWALEEGQRTDRSNHPGWDEEIVKVKDERVKWHNRKQRSYLTDVE